MKTGFFTFWIALGVISNCVEASPMPQQDEATLSPLEKRVTIAQRTKFKDFVELLRSSLGVNIVVDPRCKEISDLDSEKELVLKDIKGSSALCWVTSLYGLDYAVQGGVIIIGRTDWLSAPVLRFYDVRPLLVSPKDHPGATVSIPEDSKFGFTVTSVMEANVSVISERLVDLIKENVAPETWEEHTSIELMPDQRLMVTHFPLVQKEVARFLEALGSLTTPMVTLTAEIVEADEATSALLHPGTVATISPTEIEKISDLIKTARRDGRARAIQVTGANTQRIHARLMDEGTAVVDWKGSDVVIQSGMSEVGVLDVRPMLLANWKYISVELRLSLGQTAELSPPLKTKFGEYSFHERTATQLSTTFLVPNGGGTLFALPGRKSSGSHPQLCLLRCSSLPPPPISSRTILEPAEESTQSALVERLKKLPRSNVDLEDVSLDEFLKWFRASSGLNVVPDEGVHDQRVTIHCKGVDSAKILTLVLEPLGLGYVPREEALFITSKEKQRRIMRLALFDVRDLTYGLQDFPSPDEEGARQQFTGDDLANLIKMTIAKDQWAEADGASLVFHNGALVIRNTAEVVRACSRFVEEIREAWQNIIALRVDTMLIPAPAADPILGKAGAETYVIDEKQYERLSTAGTFLERLGWQCHENQQTSLSWSRATGYLMDFDLPDDPIPESYQTTSYINVRPTVDKDGTSITLDVNYEDRRLMDVKNTVVGEGIVIQVPLSNTASTKTTLAIPNDKIAVFKWSAPPKEDGERQYRLLILKPTLWLEKK